ncbi:MAG: hypothetical protein JO305_03635 [Alphaproteobacteria bacterium]|nr:hypothetical protein [Alphaproteobacteria bacterium]
MSTDALQIAVLVAVLLHLGALIWAVASVRGRYAVLAINVLFSAAVLVYWVPRLPGEVSFLLADRGSEIGDYQIALLCLIEFGVLVSAVLALARRHVPALLTWLGFALNFLMTLTFAVLVFALAIDL